MTLASLSRRRKTGGSRGFARVVRDATDAESTEHAVRGGAVRVRARAGAGTGAGVGGVVDASEDLGRVATGVPLEDATTAGVRERAEVVHAAVDDEDGRARLRAATHLLAGVYRVSAGVGRHVARLGSAPADVNVGKQARFSRSTARARSRDDARGSRVRLGDARTRGVDGPPRVSADAIAVGAGSVRARQPRSATVRDRRPRSADALHRFTRAANLSCRARSVGHVRRRFRACHRHAVSKMSQHGDACGAVGDQSANFVRALQRDAPLQLSDFESGEGAGKREMDATHPSRPA